MESTADYYDMDKPGKALILNHSKFAIPGMGKRNGTEYDVEKLKICIERLNFSTTVYNDLPLRKLRRVLKRETDHLNKNKISCFMMVVLTHGKLGQLYAHDNLYNIEELWANLNPSICPSIEGVPKLFFIQACRGNMIECAEMDGFDFDDSPENQLIKSPALADFLHFYSTCPGYKSLRISKMGSPFIQSICEIFDEYGTKMDLMQLTLRINDLVIRKCQELNINQVPELSSKLRKGLRFGGVNEIKKTDECNDPVMSTSEKEKHDAIMMKLQKDLEDAQQEVQMAKLQIEMNAKQAEIEKFRMKPRTPSQSSADVKTKNRIQETVVEGGVSVSVNREFIRSQWKKTGIPKLLQTASKFRKF